MEMDLTERLLIGLAVLSGLFLCGAVAALWSVGS